MEAIELANTLEPKGNYYYFKQKITLESKGCCSILYQFALVFDLSMVLSRVILQI